MSWCSMVTSTDSSLIGYGVTTANWPVEEVRKHGRISERSRFKKMPQGSSRVKALTQAGVLKHVDCKCDDNHDWYQDMSFPEIPADLLRRSLWSDCMSGAWRDVEDIFLLELRTVTKAVLDLLKYPHTHTHTQYASLIFGRQHGCSFGMLAITRETFQTYCSIAKAVCAWTDHEHQSVFSLVTFRA